MIGEVVVVEVAVVAGGTVDVAAVVVVVEVGASVPMVVVVVSAVVVLFSVVVVEVAESSWLFADVSFGCSGEPQADNSVQTMSRVSNKDRMRFIEEPPFYPYFSSSLI